eukprot:COSAG06_NODE_47553_length_336_cov_1.079498_1_plen_35_part_10
MAWPGQRDATLAARVHEAAPPGQAHVMSDQASMMV